jgi:hypothetical protein
MTTTPEPTARSQRRRWLLFGSLGCAAVLLIGAAVGIQIYWKIRHANQVSAEAQKVVQEFLGLASRGELEQAYDFFSRELKAKKSPGEFAREVAANPDHFRVPDADLGSGTVHFGSDIVEFDGTLRLQNGERIPASFVVAPEEGYWVIKSYQLGSRSAGG